MVFYLSDRLTNRIDHVWYHFKELSFLYLMTQISFGYYNADTKNIIVNTCTVCIRENTKLQWKI